MRRWKSALRGHSSGAGAAPGTAPARDKPRKDPVPGPKATKVMKKFGGRVVQVNPKDRVQRGAGPASDAASAEPDYGGEMLDPGVPPDLD